MIDLYYWPTPNGHKITVFLEEASVPYQIKPVDIGAGDQFKPEFLTFSPNNRMPAIIDHAPADGGESISVFESGAILLYLAERTGKFLSNEIRQKKTAMEWLFWQMGGFGPMLGQNHHFARYAPEKIPYAIDRYHRETERLYGVLNKRLEDREFIAGDYGIADMACYPWAAAHDWHYISLENYPNVQRWHDAIKQRPAVIKAYELGEQYKRKTDMTPEMKKNLFGITDANKP